MRADIFLAMKYERLIMRLDEICFEIGAEIGTVRNRMGACAFAIPTRKEGKYVVADVRDVGKYLDDCRDEAIRQHQNDPSIPMHHRAVGRRDGAKRGAGTES